MERPRNRKNAEKPGAYNLATRAGKTTINPGEDLKIEQYITGYGHITQVKLVCYLSSDIFDSDFSYVNHSMKFNENTKLTTWGNERSHFTDPGLTLTLYGSKEENWEEPTMIIDADKETTRLITESKHVNAPLDYNFRTLRSITPGDHYIDFNLTYFNGEKWVISKEKIPFKVRNFFERHAKLISGLALATTLLTIFRLVIFPLAEYAYDQYIDSKSFIALKKTSNQ